MSDTIEDQSNEKMITYYHVLMKNPQMSAVVSPLLYLVINKALKRSIGYAKILTFSTIGFSALTLSATYYLLETKNDVHKNKRRAYLLQRNYNQYFMEDYTTLGLILGLGFCIGIRSRSVLKYALLGSSIGFYTSGALLLGSRHCIISPDVYTMMDFSSPRK